MNCSVNEGRTNTINELQDIHIAFYSEKSKKVAKNDVLR